MKTIAQSPSSFGQVILADDRDGSRLLVRVGQTPFAHIESTLFRTYVLELLRSGESLTVELRKSSPPAQARLLVVSTPTRPRVAIAMPPQPEGAASAVLFEFPDILACALGREWWPNLLYERLQGATLCPRYARIRKLVP